MANLRIFDDLSGLSLPGIAEWFHLDDIGLAVNSSVLLFGFLAKELLLAESDNPAWCR